MNRPLVGPAALAALAIAAFTVPSAAGGPTGSIVSSFAPQRVPGQFSIDGGSAANDIVTRFVGGHYLVRDRATVTPGEFCERLRPRVARCVRWSTLDRFSAVLGPGDDRFALEIPWRGGSINGGTGDDVIRSGDHRNVLQGKEGRDVLLGRRGNDGLWGDQGRDALFGGPGNDRLDADDERRDLRIACGPGRDIALVDPALDPEPSDCEILVRPGRKSGTKGF